MRYNKLIASLISIGTIWTSGPSQSFTAESASPPVARSTSPLGIAGFAPMDRGRWAENLASLLKDISSLDNQSFRKTPIPLPQLFSFLAQKKSASMISDGQITAIVTVGSALSNHELTAGFVEELRKLEAGRNPEAGQKTSPHLIARQAGNDLIGLIKSYPAEAQSEAAAEAARAGIETLSSPRILFDGAGIDLHQPVVPAAVPASGDAKSAGEPYFKLIEPLQSIGHTLPDLNRISIRLNKPSVRESGARAPEVVREFSSVEIADRPVELLETQNVIKNVVELSPDSHEGETAPQDRMPRRYIRFIFKHMPAGRSLSRLIRPSFSQLSSHEAQIDWLLRVPDAQIIRERFEKGLPAALYFGELSSGEPKDSNGLTRAEKTALEWVSHEYLWHKKDRSGLIRPSPMRYRLKEFKPRASGRLGKALGQFVAALSPGDLENFDRRAALAATKQLLDLRQVRYKLHKYNDDWWNVEILAKGNSPLNLLAKRLQKMVTHARLVYDPIDSRENKYDGAWGGHTLYLDDITLMRDEPSATWEHEYLHMLFSAARRKGLNSRTDGDLHALSKNSDSWLYSRVLMEELATYAISARLYALHYQRSYGNGAGNSVAKAYLRKLKYTALMAELIAHQIYHSLDHLIQFNGMHSASVLGSYLEGDERSNLSLERHFEGPQSREGRLEYFPARFEDLQIRPSARRRFLGLARQGIVLKELRETRDIAKSQIPAYAALRAALSSAGRSLPHPELFMELAAAPFRLCLGPKVRYKGLILRSLFDLKDYMRRRKIILVDPEGLSPADRNLIVDALRTAITEGWPGVADLLDRLRAEPKSRKRLKAVLPKLFSNFRVYASNDLQGIDQAFLALSSLADTDEEFLAAASFVREHHMPDLSVGHAIVVGELMKSQPPNYCYVPPT